MESNLVAISPSTQQGISDGDGRDSEKDVELLDMRPPPTKKRKVDKVTTTVFKDDDSEDLEFVRLSTKRTYDALYQTEVKMI